MTTSKLTPNWRFLIQHPFHFVALGFGTGLASWAPGTFGSLMGIVLYVPLADFSKGMQLLLIAFLFLIGIPICNRAGKALGVVDDASIVWDEIVAIMLVLSFTPADWVWWLIAFVLFRLFDIFKPFPIRQAERNIPGGLGVMFDDLLAAIYSILLIGIFSA